MKNKTQLSLALLVTSILFMPACDWCCKNSKCTTKKAELTNVAVPYETKLIKKLNKALVNEWLAAYQYWIGSYVIKGEMAKPISAELETHYKEELEHAAQIAERIVQLDGTPVLTPEEWFEISPNGFDLPTEFDEESILQQNLDSEKRAIDEYNEILSLVHGKDHATYDLVASILRDEIEHKTDLEQFMGD